MAKSKIRRERTKLIAFYVSDEERDAIIACAEMMDMSISDFCRKTLLKQSLPFSCKKEDVDV